MDRRSTNEVSKNRCFAQGIVLALQSVTIRCVNQFRSMSGLDIEMEMFEFCF
jgi:hypothetical protein